MKVFDPIWMCYSKFHGVDSVFEKETYCAWLKQMINFLDFWDVYE